MPQLFSDKAGKMKKLSINGRFLFLALDHGLEHGPRDFNESNIDPSSIIGAASKMRITGLILQKGLAVHYKEHYAKKVPLIIKLNGKTSISNYEPFSPQITTVKEAVEIGADAVGYTIYPGSRFEAEMLEAAGAIEREARDYGLPLILWSYPRGEAVKDPLSAEMMAYAARIALEIGADMVKIQYGGKKEALRWAVSAAGKCKVLTAGGRAKSEEDFLKEAKDMMDAGANGMAVGRNIWQHEDPVGIANSLASIIFGE